MCGLESVDTGTSRAVVGGADWDRSSRSSCTSPLHVLFLTGGECLACRLPGMARVALCGVGTRDAGSGF